MSLLSRLESRFGRWAIPNVTVIIIAGQVLLYFLYRTQSDRIDQTATWLIPGRVMQGEVWRLVTFIFSPPLDNPLFVVFGWILTYIFGTSLERIWGVVRFNTYLLIAYFSYIVACFLIWFIGGDILLVMSQILASNQSFGLISTNTVLTDTLFLAFARLHPNFVINAYFVLPIRIYWLAIIYWLAHGYVLLRGNWAARLLVLAAIANYLVFFGRDHYRDWKQGNRHRSFQAKAKAASKAIQHQCQVCELNSENSPRTLFRYCSKCDGQQGYCPEHIQNHEHVTDESAQATKS